MANVNKVFLLGRLTRDPELRYTPGGTAVTDLGLAVNRYFTARDGEARTEETLFIDVTVWSRQAENCCQFLKKGQQVHVEGYLRTDSWDDKTTGEKRTKIKVVADNVQFLGGSRDEAGNDAPAPPREAPAPVRSRPGRPVPATARRGPIRTRLAPPSSGRRPAPADPEPESEEVDDDIPF